MLSIWPATPTRRTLQLPGLAIEVLPGPGPVMEGPARDVPYGDVFISSEPRRFLENLTRGRGWAERVLPQQELEVQLARALMTMFVVTEVHPFTDGNGRTARLAMNAELTASEQSARSVPIPASRPTA